MEGVFYPRPQPEPAPESLAAERTAATLAIVLSCCGLVSAAEVLLVGEELSTLGDRLLEFSRNDGALHHLQVRYGIGPGLMGFVVFGISALRLAAAAGWAAGQRWGALTSAFCAVLGILVDLACFSVPLVVFAMLFDALIVARLAWRFAR